MRVLCAIDENCGRFLTEVAALGAGIGLHAEYCAIACHVDIALSKFLHEVH